MKRINLLVGMLLTTAMAFALGLSTLSAFADTHAFGDTPEISLEEDFDETSVLVTLTEEISEVNKVYDKSFSGDIEIQANFATSSADCFQRKRSRSNRQTGRY